MEIALETRLQSRLPATLTAVAEALPGVVKGQRLLAEVIGRRADNLINLRVNGSVVAARSEIPLPAGRTLTVEVVKTGPQVVLKVDNPLPQPTKTIAQALAASLPRQASAVEAWRNLNHIATQNVSSNGEQAAKAPLPAALKQAVGQLLSHLPQAEALKQAAILKQTVLNELQPLENKLARKLSAPSASGSPPNGTPAASPAAIRSPARLATTQTPTLTATANPAVRDRLEMVLKQFNATLQSSPAPTNTANPGNPKPSQAISAQRDFTPSTTFNNTAAVPAADGEMQQVQQQLEQLAARFKTQLLQNSAAATQTNSLHNQSHHLASFSVELPVRVNDAVHLWQFEFEQEATPEQTDTDTPRRASVTVAVNFSPDHVFRARISLSGERLAIGLDSNNSQMKAAINEQLPRLVAQLTATGLTLGDLRLSDLAPSDASRAISLPLVEERI